MSSQQLKQASKKAHSQRHMRASVQLFSALARQSCSKAAASSIRPCTPTIHSPAASLSCSSASVAGPTTSSSCMNATHSPHSLGTSTRPSLHASRHFAAHLGYHRHLSSAHAVQQYSASTGGPSSSDSSSSVPGEQPQQQLPSRRVKYSPLHYDIEEFCRRVVPTEEERKLKLQVIEM